MTVVFGIPLSVLFGQVLLGLINGAFYALLSLGLAIIFGLLRIINFAHGAQYMLGAFIAVLGLNYLGLNSCACNPPTRSPSAHQPEQFTSRWPCAGRVGEDQCERRRQHEQR
ncbi:hypothetical protein AL066_10190 [Pseudomonas nunensis]|nr:hypothetical protein AL066_10190 [Pseudomonas nunensis]